MFQYSLTRKDGSDSWKTVPAVPVPLSVSGKTVPTVPVSGSGSVPEPPCLRFLFLKNFGANASMPFSPKMSRWTLTCSPSVCRPSGDCVTCCLLEEAEREWGAPPRRAIRTPRIFPRIFCAFLRDSGTQARKRHTNINFFVRLVLGRPRVCPGDFTGFVPGTNPVKTWDKPGFSPYST